jgi:hypothetical protein
MRWGQFMLKQSNKNYWLWPRQARPPGGIPLRLGGGGFVVGAVCTIAAYSVIFDVVGPLSLQEPAGQSGFGHFSIDVPSVAPAAAPALTPLETESSASRTRGQAVKAHTPPRIESQAALPSAATDGRGSEALAEYSPVAAPDAKPAAATKRPVNPSKPIVRKKRERPTSYAAGYRQGPVYRGVSQTASWY